jgi:hypothetical protein
MEGVEYTAEITLKNVPQDYKSSGAGVFKIVKMKIVQELQNELIKEIVQLSGGDISKISHILDD